MPEAPSDVAVTEALKRWRAGDSNALNSALPALYAELAANARGVFRRVGGGGATLQPTALINEGLIKLAGSDIDWNDRCHFLAVMTQAMRQVLVDHARSQGRAKRGGDAQRVTLATDFASDAPGTDLLDLEEALDGLRAQDARKAQVVEMHYYGGMTYPEIGQVLELSEATVHRELRFARAWLKTQLSDAEALPESR